MNHILGEDRTALARRATLLHLSAISLAEEMRSGTFKSLYHGQGVEFSGVRDYLRGDDVRSIDWNVTARMGKPFVKLFEEERELTVFLVVDHSLSMNTVSGNRTRLEVAMECASLLSLASLQNASPVGAVLFNGEITFSCAPKAGRDQVRREQTVQPLLRLRRIRAIAGCAWRAPPGAPTFHCRRPSRRHRAARGAWRRLPRREYLE